MGRPRKVIEELIVKQKSEKLAPKDCPMRKDRCRMYVWFCKGECKEFGECEVWGNFKKEE